MIGTALTKERLFCMIAYLPKATVQAAIGSVPLSMGPWGSWCNGSGGSDLITPFGGGGYGVYL
ncbi:MAG: hypothetical protein ACLUVV_01235 [Christensenellales bacterium]